MSGGHTLGVDVGGTFTDVVLAGPRGQEAVAKTLSTPSDPAEGILRGVRTVLDAAGVRPGRVERVVHATTLATNLVLERRGGRVAFLTTAGFGAMLTLGRHARVEEDRYDLLFDPPAPPVRAEDCFEVPERVDAGGQVVVPLDEDAVRRTAAEIRDRGITAVAVCLLHAYAGPAHERRVAEILAETLPEHATICASHAVWPEMREYERATTTLMSAYVGPVMTGYLAGLGDRLTRLGITAPVQVMESGGGVMSAELAGRRAVATIESGPAAGVIAARRVGLDAGRADVVSFDMGGTTAKACVIRDGSPQITREFHVGGKGSFGGRRAGTGTPIKTPAIDLAEVGAGGGSVAWIDDAGALRVGPRSAGSEPGPACYDRGGEDPTVTDANLVLGYLDPAAFAQGAFELRHDLAAKAMNERIAAPLGVDVAEAAHAVHEIANTLMGSAVQVVTVQRGIDPRGFALVALGGAGPVHGARVAERFGITTVIVPPSCGVGSAVGLLATDLSTDRARTVTAVTPEQIEDVYAALTRDATADLGVDPADSAVRVRRSADVRYQGQGHELTVPVGDGPYTPAAHDRLAWTFRDRYRAAFGIAPDDPVEVIGLRVRVTRTIPRVELGVRPVAAEPAPPGVRPAWFPETGGFTPTPVYDRHRCRPGDRMTAPAIVQDGESTVIVPPGWTARVDDGHNIVLTADREAR